VTVASTVTKLLRHVRQLWPGAGIWLPAPFVLWTLGWLAAGKVRWEHVLLGVLVPVLAYTSAKTKRLFIGLLPFALLGLIYDAMRWVKNVGLTPERVHLCDLRALDMRIASVTVDGAPGTVHDWVQAHTSPALDVACAVPYGTFIYVTVAFAVFLYAKDYARMRMFGWTFLILNIAGFVTYHVYPAAPPWYFHAHGCSVDLGAHASEGANLARVDALMGIGYFRGFYGRSSDVFGAVPSLHVSYPFLMVLFGWPVLRWPGRAFAIVFFAAMCTAAVYLDHHWIIDVLLGLAYTVAVYVAVVFFFARSSAFSASPAFAKSSPPPETAS
jgi:inositol phosphorylceramide synthase catalytic subunit